MRNGSPAFTAAVFDMDGLLLDSERPTRDAWLQAAAALGTSISEADYLSVVGLNHIDSQARFLTLFGGDVARLAAAHAHAAAALSAGPPFLAKPGAQRLLRALREARIPCAVASSTHRGGVRQRLQQAGLLDHFSALCGGDEVSLGKPSPDLYLLALQRLGAAASASIAFEDSGHGVQAALAAGLATVAVPDLKAPAPEWLARCHAVLPSLDAVCEHSPEWFGVICAR
jgi:beta-phosphoglucomutase-like phosphatase (HAD superfamily)